MADSVKPDIVEESNDGKLKSSSASASPGEVTVLHISNLSRNVKNTHLREIFSNYGEVVSVELEVDKRVGLSKGFAYVKFGRAEEAEEAAAYMDGGQIDGMKISVAFVLVSKKRKESPEETRKETSNILNTSGRGREVRERDERGHDGRSRGDDRSNDERRRPEERRAPPPDSRRERTDDKYHPTLSRSGQPPRPGGRGRSRSPVRDRVARRDSRGRRDSPPRRSYRGPSPSDRRAPAQRRGRSRSPVRKEKRSRSRSPPRRSFRDSESRSRSPERRRRYSSSSRSSSSYSSSSRSSSDRSRSRSDSSDRRRSRSPSRSPSPKK